MRAPTAPALVSLLRQCFAMGAHPRTLTLLSGSNLIDLRRWVLPPAAAVSNGRPPYRLLVDGVARATPLRVAVCGFVTDYLRLRERGIDAMTALVYAYVPRRGHVPDAFTFDAAFFLVSGIDGRWAFPRPCVIASACLPERKPCAWPLGESIAATINTRTSSTGTRDEADCVQAAGADRQRTHARMRFTGTSLGRSSRPECEKRCCLEAR